LFGDMPGLRRLRNGLDPVVIAVCAAFCRISGIILHKR
jgi:hypothetical protein